MYKSFFFDRMFSPFKWLVRRPRNWLSILGLTILLFVLTIWLTSFPNPIQHYVVQYNLNHFEKLWFSRNITRYQYEVEIGSAFEHWNVLIEVREGSTISETLVGEDNWGYLKDFNRCNTIEKMFGIIQNALLQKDDVIEVSFDLNLGFPKKILIYSPFWLDDGIHYTITKLVVLR